MNDQDWLAERFEANRSHLRGVAFRMLGSVTEADDAVQEAWIRLSRTDTSDVDNLRAWLTTVVGRVCLNMLRSRKTRREASLETHLPDPDRESGERHRSRAGGPAGRLGRARHARRPRLADARRTGRLRAPRRLRRAVRRDRADRRPDADGDEAAREPRPSPRPGCARAGRRSRRPVGRRRRVPRGGARRRLRTPPRRPRPGRRAALRRRGGAAGSGLAGPRRRRPSPSRR